MTMQALELSSKNFANRDKCTQAFSMCELFVQNDLQGFSFDSISTGQ